MPRCFAGRWGSGHAPRRGAKDLLLGGNGADQLFGRAADKLFGQAGPDVLNGGAGQPDLCNSGLGRTSGEAGCELRRLIP
jgi:Ca2+-binding RTX toxin-like protein